MIPVRLSDLIKDGDIDQNVAMAPGDILLIPQSLLLGAAPMHQFQHLLRQQLTAAWRYRWPAILLFWLVCAAGWIGGHADPEQSTRQMAASTSTPTRS